MFDYGCGRGNDIRELCRLGFQAAGWDPAHARDEERHPGQVVNLGYVLNVIEKAAERSAVLKAAWGLAEELLVVSARTEDELRDFRGRPHADGFITSTGTFQKFYSQAELRDWVTAVLGVVPVALAPGVFAVFRDESDRQGFIAERHRRKFVLPRLRKFDQLYDANTALFEEFAEFICYRGRLPKSGEFASEVALREAVGTPVRAFNVLRSVTDSEEWERIVDERAQDLLIGIALAHFDRLPRFSEWPEPVRHDIRAHFGNYKAACETAQKALLTVGDQVMRELVIRQSRIGKQTPSALYVHVSALSGLHPVLRLFEGCARQLVGVLPETALVKLSREEPRVSYLGYPYFDSEPHPALAWSLSVHLQTFAIKTRRYDQSKNPPILHRKEEFVGMDFPGRDKFARLTAQEERAGLYKEPESIGTRNGWNAALERQGKALRGHRLVVRR